MSKRKTCKRLENTDETTSSSRSNKCDVLEQIDSDLEVKEVNLVDLVQEVAEITVDSGAAESVWPIRKKGVTTTKTTEKVRLAATIVKKKSDACGRSVRLEFVRERKMCNMKFLEADVKRPLASVFVIVAEGNVVVFGRQDSHIEKTSTGQRIPMGRRKRVGVGLSEEPETVNSAAVKVEEIGREEDEETLGGNGEDGVHCMRS